MLSRGASASGSGPRAGAAAVRRLEITGGSLPVVGDVRHQINAGDGEVAVEVALDSGFQ